MKNGKPESGNEIMYDLVWGSFERKKKQELESTIEFYEIIEEISLSDLMGSIKYLQSKCQFWRRENRYRFDDVFIEEVSLNRGCGDYEHCYYVLGKRMETPEETSSRVALNNSTKLELEKKEKEKHKNKEDKERLAYERLKRKYE